MTKIYNSLGEPLATYLMENPWECMFIDDHMTMHEVSPVYKLTDDSESYRDMLVLTFQKN